MKKLILAALVCAAISCKKDDVSKFPIKFYGQSVAVKTATRLFIHTGEIKNPSEIAAFINGSVYFTAENDQSGKGTFGMELISADSARFGTDRSKYSIKKSGNQYLFYAELGGGLPNTNKTDFKSNLLKYTYSAPSPGPLGTFDTAREVKVAYGNTKELRFQRIAYLAVSRSSGSFSSSGGIANNEFNETALSLMHEGDTLAIKTYEVIFQAK